MTWTRCTILWHLHLVEPYLNVNVVRFATHICMNTKRICALFKVVASITHIAFACLQGEPVSCV